MYSLFWAMKTDLLFFIHEIDFQKNLQIRCSIRFLY